MRALPWNRLKTLWPDPATTSLAWWIVGVQLVLVLVVGIGLSATATGMLRGLADGQGRARALLAGASAHESVRRATENALTDAEILAQRPTLQRLLGERREAAIQPFLGRFCATSLLVGCAVVKGSTVLAASGPPIDWPGIVAESAEQGSTFLALPMNRRGAVAGASASVPGNPGIRVYVVRLLDVHFAGQLTHRLGLSIQFVDYRSYVNDPVNALTPLYASALAEGRGVVQRVDALGLYVASVPVFASSGEAIAFINASLPVAVIDTSTANLIRRLVLTTLVLAALAIGAGILLARRVVAPLKALTDSAGRIGHGDFSVAIPPGGAAEVGTLARTMEDMRSNLLVLTETLRRREAEAQAVLAGIVEGVYAVDQDRRIRYLNAQAARLLGVDPGEVIGQFCGDVLKPCAVGGERPCERHCPILAARGAGSAQALERLQVGNLPVRTAVITSAGLVDGLQVQVIRDETDIEAARRARDSVLANISHEFRTPLAAQLASIELLLDNLGSMPTASLRELVESLQRGSQRLTRLIDNLLESVRIESGQLAIRAQSVDLGEVVDHARTLVVALFTQRRQRLEITLPPGLPPLTGDAHRLTQVFVNLLANANKFAPEGSTVRVGAERNAGTVSAWVEDEGPGPLAGEALFERFGRGPGAEPQAGGLGLGLWIVRSIVDRHGGTVTFSRTAAARTRFTLTLPTEESA